MSLKEIPRLLFAVLAGSLLYVILVWIPLIGPLIVGLTAGWIARCNVRKGFFIGVLSGFTGFLYLVHIAFPDMNFFLWWIFLVWNLFAFLFTGVGAVLGSMMSKTNEFFTYYKNSFAGGNKPYEPQAEVYTLIICPNCGLSNPEESVYCSSCGNPLGRG
ncbi:MAG: zinc ribbon domain-containing protein [Candidatus Altiarchaeota archaeon]|nr:zinc ribbon domain-containing protein [Candidatus Altiarchaeota archaeon]